MANINKVSVERAAYNKAGYILLFIVTNRVNDDYILKDKRNLNILIQEDAGLLRSNIEQANDNTIRCLRAGSLSEKHYCWLKCINYDPSMSGDDLWLFSRLLFRGDNGSLNFDEHIKILEEETEKIILMHWPFIKAAAGKLLAKKEPSIEDFVVLWEKSQEKQ